ncbi:MAG: hypothetical protein HYZ28_03725 [Myxococcales bacterium]|nr:hypothetical protein [Myxococcales bacterium]
MRPGGNVLGVSRRVAVAFLCAALACGCKAGFTKRLWVRPSLKISAVAVYPFVFRWEEPAYRSFELSQKLIDAVAPKGGDYFRLYGPSEFKVYRPDDDNAWAATSAVALLPSAGLVPDQAVVLRPVAEKRVQSGQKEVLDAKGRPLGTAAVQEVTYIGRVEILHPTTGDMVVEVRGQAEVDPFAVRLDDGADPAPELTALMQALAVEALASLAHYAAPKSGPLRELDIAVAFNPKLAFTYSEGGRPALEVKLSSLDPVEAELLSQGRVKFANPDLTDAEVAKLVRLPGGLYVRKVPKGSKLEVGDVVMAIDGESALPQSLHRLRFTSVPGRLKVRRASGETAEVEYP